MGRKRTRRGGEVAAKRDPEALGDIDWLDPDERRSRRREKYRVMGVLASEPERACSCALLGRESIVLAGGTSRFPQDPLHWSANADKMIEIAPGASFHTFHRLIPGFRRRSEQGKSRSCSRLVKKALRSRRQSTGELDEYRRKRRPAKTPEPFGSKRRSRGSAAAVRRPAARRAPAALRLPARARRRARELGGSEGDPAPSRRAPPRGARRGSPARVRRLRGDDPGRRVRRGHGRDLGSRGRTSSSRRRGTAG